MHPEVQRKLREEILTFDREPTYDQLSKDFPYLDAVVHEVLRLHPSSPDFPCMIKRSPQHIVSLLRLHFQATEDNVIPLSQPVCTKLGEVAHNIFVARGTFVTVPTTFINCLEALWVSRIDRFSLGPIEEGSKRGHDGSRGGRGSS